jgi:hypothetical protein
MARKDEKIARSARIAVEKWREYFKYNIDMYHLMHTFVLGNQWNTEESDMLKSFKKVPLQFNKLGTLINTLLGEQQQNTPQIEVIPLSNCDEETAEIRQIVVKDIMLSTDAKKVYQEAAKQAFIGGFGAYIVDTDYTHNKSFDQEIVYRHLKDATRAYWDIGAEDTNKIDGMRAGYIQRITRQKFRQIYGRKIEKDIIKTSAIKANKEEVRLAVQPDTVTDPFNWADEEGITIIHDYSRKFRTETLYKLSNGKIVNKKELQEMFERSQEIAEQKRLQMMMSPPVPTQNNVIEQEGFVSASAEMAEQSLESEQPVLSAMPDESEDFSIITLYDGDEIVRIEDEREHKQSYILQRKIAGDYILDESEFPSEDLPIIFVDQNSYFDKTGKQICRSCVGDAMDAQRFINYLGTQIAFILKVSRYDQFIASKKNVQGMDTQQIWQDPSKVQGALIYDESPSGAKPEQLRPPELPVSLTQQYQRAIEDLYTSTGLYPTRLGQEGNEISGAAIDARTRQGSYPTYVAFNSINRAITAGGKIVNQMIPRVYDTERVLNLMMPDKGRRTVVVNKALDEYGVKIENDLRSGTFEVRLQAGPSYEGQKMEALQSLREVLQANPQIFNLIADLYAENLPLANTLELKNRLKTLVPSEIIEAGKTGTLPPKEQRSPDPEEQAIMADIQFKQQQIAIKQQELELKKQEQASKIEIQMIEAQIKELEALANLEQQKLRYLAETDRTRSDNAISHADNITKIITQMLNKQDAMEKQQRGNYER